MTSFVSSTARFCALVFLVTTVVAFLAWRAVAQDDARTACEPENGCWVRFTHFSDQATEPFLFSGKTMDRGHPRFDEYRWALRKYNDLGSCMELPASDGELSNPLLFDWAKIKRPQAIDVCLYRVFRSLDDLKAIRTWLEAHDFEVFEIVRTEPVGYKPSHENEPVMQMSAKWSRENTGTQFQSFLGSLFGRESDAYTSLVIGISESGDVVGVYFRFNYF